MSSSSSAQSNMSKSRIALFCIALWVSAWVGCYQTAELVVVNEMYLAFPDQEGVVTAFVSWPMFAVAAGAILAGILLQKMSTKLLCTIAAVLLLFGGIATLFEGNIVVVLVCVLLQAFGAGLCNTGGMAIISEVFLEDTTRARHMGFYNAAMTVLGAGSGFAAGVLAEGSWIHAFWVNWISVPMLILIVLFFPNIKPEDRVEEAPIEEDAPSEVQSGKGFGLKFWVFFLSMTLFFLTIVPMYSFNSVLIAENELGGTSFAGLVGGVMTGCVAPAALLFGVLYEKLHRKCTFIGIIPCIIGAIWLYLAPSTISMMAMAVIEGLMVGIMLSLLTAYAASIVPPERNGFAMGLMLFLYNASVACGVYLFDACSASMGSLTSALIIAIGLLVAALVVEIVVQFVETGRSKARKTA